VNRTPIRSPALRVVISPDSFKGSLDAPAVAAALARGWARVRPGDELIPAPMADGGEGTIDTVFAATPGAERVPVQVRGPDGRPVRTSWVRLPDGTGVVELASTSGITLLDRLRPSQAHTFGFGQAILAALDGGAHRLLLALGGSASSDGGVGALTALGAQFLDRDGTPIPLGNLGLHRLVRVDFERMRAAPPGGAVLLSDVRNPLLGAHGAAQVFGRQKGAGKEERKRLERGLGRLVEVLDRSDIPGRLDGTPSALQVAGRQGAGAAGGTGFGLLLWGAQAHSGADHVARVIGLQAALATADLVVTGEGRYDDQSASGKVVSVVHRLASASGADVALVGGAISAEPREFTAFVSLTELAGDRDEAIRYAATWLEVAGSRLAASWSPSGRP